MPTWRILCWQLGLHWRVGQHILWIYFILIIPPFFISLLSYSGFLCSSCSENFYQYGSQCSPCSNVSKVGSLLLFIIFLLSLCNITSWLTHSKYIIIYYTSIWYIFPFQLTQLSLNHVVLPSHCRCGLYHPVWLCVCLRFQAQLLNDMDSSQDLAVLHPGNKAIMSLITIVLSFQNNLVLLPLIYPRSYQCFQRYNSNGPTQWSHCLTFWAYSFLIVSK